MGIVGLPLPEKSAELLATPELLNPQEDVKNVSHQGKIALVNQDTPKTPGFIIEEESSKPADELHQIVPEIVPEDD